DAARAAGRCVGGAGRRDRNRARNPGLRYRESLAVNGHRPGTRADGSVGGHRVIYRAVAAATGPAGDGEPTYAARDGPGAAAGRRHTDTARAAGRCVGGVGRRDRNRAGNPSLSDSERLAIDGDRPGARTNGSVGGNRVIYRAVAAATGPAGDREPTYAARDCPGERRSVV